MVCEDGKVKILDEAIIKLDYRRRSIFGNLETDDSKMMDILTLLSLAPERVGRECNAQMTAFSLGMVLLQMFEGGKEFATVDAAKLEKIRKNMENNEHPVPSTTPEFWRKLIQDCLNTKPESRPALPEIRDKLLIQHTQRAVNKIQQEEDSLLAKIPKEIMNAIHHCGLFPLHRKAQSESLNISTNPGISK
jgi:hypothetical protein